MISSAPADQSGFQLRQTTERLRTLLDHLLSPAAAPGALPRTATPAQMSMLLSDLMQTGEWLRKLSDRQRSEVQPELEGYRAQVERLHALLPNLQSVLLAERARLERERDRLNAASEWVRASSQTL